MDFILTDHVEDELAAPSGAVYAELERLIRLADRTGYQAAWLAEHHFHVHRGHLPNPLLLAVHLAARTRRIKLGSAVICTALHHPLRLAEDLLAADALTGGRLSIGLGSGSTAPEFAAYDIGEEGQATEARHARFAEQVEVLEQAWRGGPISVHGRFVHLDAPPLLPRAIRPLADILWIAANSAPQAVFAGHRGYGLMLSRERPVQDLQQLSGAYRAAWQAAGHAVEQQRIAVSRAVYVGRTAHEAERATRAAIGQMVERQRLTRAEYALLPAPATFAEACARVRFDVGTAATIAASLRELYQAAPFTAFHIQPRWQGITARDVEQSVRRFAQEVVPLLSGLPG